MQHTKWMIFSAFLSVFVLSGCLKDTEEFVPLEEYIETSAFGVALGDLNLPVENATVAYEGERTVTDSNGIFIFSDVVIPSTGGRLEVSAPGYFNTFQFVDPTSDVRSVNIHLNSLGPDHSFSGSAGGNITTSDEVIMSVPRNGLARSNGDVYSGAIITNIGYVDPTGLDAYDQVPGGNFGQNSDGINVLLEHYGTVYTQFRTQSGEELFVADQMTFQLEFPVSDDLTGEAPSQVTLWKLDRDLGKWVEKGRADLQNDRYIAIVDETGTWSIQMPFRYARLSGRVKTDRNQPVERARIAISRESSSIKTRVWTDSEGRFTAFYPIDNSLDIDVEDECGTVLYETSQGPILGDHELGSFEIDPGDRYWKLTGVITECGTLSTGISAGYSFIQTPLYRWITPVERSGGFSTGLFNCGNKFIVLGRDLVNNKGTNAVDISDFADKERNYSLGIMEACR